MTGATAFELRFELSEEPADVSYVTVRDALFAVTGGSIANASRQVQGRNRGWKLKVTPSGLGDVTLRLEATTSCDALPGVCTSDGRMLGGGLSVTVPGPAALIVADAEVAEAEGATLDFVVTLSQGAHERDERRLRDRGRHGDGGERLHRGVGHAHLSHRARPARRSR